MIVPIPSAPPLDANGELLRAFNEVTYKPPNDLLFGQGRAFFSDATRSSQTWHMEERCRGFLFSKSHGACENCSRRQCDRARKAILESVEQYQLDLIAEVTRPRPAA